MFIGHETRGEHTSHEPRLGQVGDEKRSDGKDARPDGGACPPLREGCVQFLESCTEHLKRYCRRHPWLSRAYAIFLFVLLLAGALTFVLLSGPAFPGPLFVFGGFQWELFEGTAQFIINNLAGLLAITPSILAFGYYALGRKREFVTRQENALRYLAFRREFARSRSDGEPFFLELGYQGESGARKRSVPLEDELALLRPRPLEYLLGAVLLAAPFLAMAALSDALFLTRGYVPGMRFGDPESQHVLKSGIEGIVFTGYGVYTYTLVALIHRIHASALSTEFLLSAALRATLMMVLGFGFGLTGIFRSNEVSTSSLGLFVYLAVGAFPSWGYEAFRKKARQILRPEAAGTSNFSLEYVDGLDEPIMERLEEMGISNAQHLATMDPVELTLKTLYPFHRIIDWIDQAILITYLQHKIVQARELGIRGAIDMSSLHLDVLAARGRASSGTHAEQGQGQDDVGPDPVALFKELSTSTKLSLPLLHNIGASLADDFFVQLLARLWHHRGASSSSLRGRLILAISKALSRCGIDVGDALRTGRIPLGECPQCLSHSPLFSRRFPACLDEELRKLGIQWGGSVDELRRMSRFADIYEAILARLAALPRSGQSSETPPGGQGQPRASGASDAWGRAESYVYVLARE